MIYHCVNFGLGPRKKPRHRLKKQRISWRKISQRGNMILSRECRNSAPNISRQSPKQRWKPKRRPTRYPSEHGPIFQPEVRQRNIWQYFILCSRVKTMSINENRIHVKGEIRFLVFRQNHKITKSYLSKSWFFIFSRIFSRYCRLFLIFRLDRNLFFNRLCQTKGPTT